MAARALLSGAGGILVALGLAWLGSSHRRRVPVRALAGGLALQFSLAFLILRTGFGERLARVLVALAAAVFAPAANAVLWLAGNLADSTAAPGLLTGEWLQSEPGALGLVAGAAAAIVFAAVLLASLHHGGLLPRLARLLGAASRPLLGISGEEALIFLASPFLGSAQTPFVARPWLSRLTASQLFALLVAGMAPVSAVSALAASQLAPGLAPAILAFAFVSSPAALAVAKLMEPETEPAASSPAIESRESSVLAVITRSSWEGVRVALAAAALLVAGLALLLLIDSGLRAVPHPGFPELSLVRAGDWASRPFTAVAGIIPDDRERVGDRLGSKLVYGDLLPLGQSLLASDGSGLAPRSFFLTLGALFCLPGLGAIAIQLGALSQLGTGEPARRGLAKLTGKAWFGSLLAALLTVSVVGMFPHRGSLPTAPATAVVPAAVSAPPAAAPVPAVAPLDDTHLPAASDLPLPPLEGVR